MYSAPTIRWPLRPLIPTTILLLFTWGGCATTAHRIVSCPLTYSEQEREILTVVPKGTQRDAALALLEKAGIQGNFGISRRVYYCDVWDRSNGERWHLDVALMFDESGKLYRTQAADSEVTAVPDDSAGKNKPENGAPITRGADKRDASSSAKGG